MTIFIPGNTAVENTRTLARSALPGAPVVADEPRGGFEIRARAGALLRTPSASTSQPSVVRSKPGSLMQ